MNDLPRESTSRVPAGAVLCVVGARPNLMKIAPIIAALRKPPTFVPVSLVHTGQHYDAAMNDAFFEQLGIPAPEIHLEVGSASHAVQTAEIMRRFEPVVLSCAPAAVLVVGDVNSTIACALVAAKERVPVVHVEAGLRSFDRCMPEEINRVLTDQLSDLLFTTEQDARDNLLREGIEADRIHFVGNVMIDTLLLNRQRAVPAIETRRRLAGPDRQVEPGEPFAVITLHRPSNVDRRETLEPLVGAIAELGRTMQVLFPLHPRTRRALDRFGLHDALVRAGILCAPPLGYLELLGLMAEARMVLTDSGGIQEETTALGVPCITMRENTERPITVRQGTNTVAGTDPREILRIAGEIAARGGKAGRVPELWDGKAALRIRTILEGWLESRKAGQRFGG